MVPKYKIGDIVYSVEQIIAESGEFSVNINKIIVVEIKITANDIIYNDLYNETFIHSKKDFINFLDTLKKGC